MNPADGFAVEPGSLRDHADTVSDFGSRLRAAVAAARQTVGPDAYGMVGRVFAGAVIEATQRAGSAVAQVSDATDDQARHLQATVAGYLLTDVRIAESLRGLE